jgi:DNA-directed RNA polymerase specialized sigma24 family protein
VQEEGHVRGELPEELGEILDTAVESLEPPYRSVFVLRDIDELSTEETAEALNLSIPAVVDQAGGDQQPPALRHSRPRA